MRDCAAMVVVMSRSGRESEWVERETLLAMGLHKPLFVALIEEVPLPLHLINRQFTDFQENGTGFKDDTARRLAMALREVLGKDKGDSRQPRKLSPQPSEENFFGYLEQLPGGEPNALIARDLYAWAKKHADHVTFGGKFTPGFHVRLKLESGEITVFSLWAYSQQPAVQVQFQYFRRVSPYKDLALRLATLKSLGVLAKKPFADEKADRRPTIALSALNTAEALETFKATMAEVITNLRGK